MDQSDYIGLTRDLLKVVGGVLVAHGAVTEGNVELISGVVIAVAPITVTVTSPTAPQTSTAQQASAALEGPILPTKGTSP